MNQYIVIGIEPEWAVVDEEGWLLAEEIGLGGSQVECQFEEVDNSRLRKGVPWHGDEVEIMVEGAKYLSLFCLEHLLSEYIFAAFLVALYGDDLLFGYFGC